MIIPENLLESRKILLGVCGSIAAYKSLELVRLFVKAGAEVKVVMSEAAGKFVTPLSFETLSRHRVLHAQSESWADDHNHIMAAQWADVMVIAPASANTIAKLAVGIADNLLLQCALAASGARLIAPSANTNMLHNPITEAALKTLETAGYGVIASQTKELACRTTGDGAMAEPLEIFWQTARALMQDDFWKQRRVIVTGGGTVEKIDDVRYLSNFSSGKMASALAAALFLKGADVSFIATRSEPGLPLSLRTFDAESSQELHACLSDALVIAKSGVMCKTPASSSDRCQPDPKTPYLFMAAAVSDYVPQQPHNGKLKKATLGDTWTLSLNQNMDIIDSIDKQGIKTVAFKAEFDAENALENAKKALASKQVDAVCLNVLTPAQGFGSRDNAITFVTQEAQTELGRQDKLTLSLKLLEKAQKL